MKLNELINENVNTICYLIKSIKSLRDIIDKDHFILEKISERTDTEKSYYFLKTIKNRNSNEITSLLKQRENKITVLIKLDGEKINSELKRKGNDRLINYYNSKYDDRIFNDSIILKNAKTFIDEISVISPNDSNSLNQVLNIKNKVSGIPFFIYTNKDDFISNNRNKAYKKPEKINPNDLLFPKQ